MPAFGDASNCRHSGQYGFAGTIQASTGATGIARGTGLARAFRLRLATVVRWPLTGRLSPNAELSRDPDPRPESPLRDFPQIGHKQIEKVAGLAPRSAFPLSGGHPNWSDECCDVWRAMAGRFRMRGGDRRFLTIGPVRHERGNKVTGWRAPRGRARLPHYLRCGQLKGNGRIGEPAMPPPM